MHTWESLNGHAFEILHTVHAGATTSRTCFQGKLVPPWEEFFTVECSGFRNSVSGFTTSKGPFCSFSYVVTRQGLVCFGVNYLCKCLIIVAIDYLVSFSLLFLFFFCFLVLCFLLSVYIYLKVIRKTSFSCMLFCEIIIFFALMRSNHLINVCDRMTRNKSIGIPAPHETRVKQLQIDLQCEPSET